MSNAMYHNLDLRLEQLFDERLPFKVACSRIDSAVLSNSIVADYLNADFKMCVPVSLEIE